MGLPSTVSLSLDSGSTSTIASTVINETQSDTYKSMFLHEIHQEDSIWDPPVFNGFCKVIEGLGNICKYVRGMIYHSRHLVFKTFWTRHAQTNSLICENLVQLTYYDRRTK